MVVTADKSKEIGQVQTKKRKKMPASSLSWLSFSDDNFSAANNLMEFGNSKAHSLILFTTVGTINSHVFYYLTGTGAHRYCLSHPDYST